MNNLAKIFVLPLFLLSNIAAAEVVATVNGKDITQADLNNHIKIIQSATHKQDIDPKQALNDLINREVMYQEAIKQKIDQDPNVKYMVEIQAREVYSNFLLSKSEANKPITDEELKKLYDEKIKPLDLKEYKVRHIVFKKENTDGEKQAKAIIAQLDAGKDFVELAKQKSQGPSAPKGGDIGWVNPATLRNMPGFMQAISEMKKGGYSKKPVKSNIGWHVLKLDDVRKTQPASFEQSKAQLRKIIQQNRVNAYVKKLHDSAKIEVKMK